MLQSNKFAKKSWSLIRLQNALSGGTVKDPRSKAFAINPSQLTCDHGSSHVQQAPSPRPPSANPAARSLIHEELVMEEILTVGWQGGLRRIVWRSEVDAEADDGFEASVTAS